MKYFVVLLAICSLVISHSEAEDLMEKVKKIAEECKTQLGATEEEMAGLFKYEPAANDKVKCLHACAMKKLGILDENNKLNESKTIDYIKSVAAGNANVEKLSTEVLSECKNTPANSDVCEFAETFRNCVLESAKSKGLDVIPQ